MIKGILFSLILYPLFSCAQKEDRVWVFSDSVCINFNNASSPLVYSLATNETLNENYASVATKNGELLYYIGSGHTFFGNPYYFSAIYDENEIILSNGDSLESSRSLTQGTLFIPSINDTNITYLFFIDMSFTSVALQPGGLYYCILDKSQNGGNGSCISKNNFLVHDTLTEKLTAVRHGNGRDWWIIVHANESKDFYKFLLTPQGFFGPMIQTIGPQLIVGSPGQIKFSPDGSKLGLVSTDKHVALFDFDRCTGMLSNYKNLGKSNSYGCSFSPSGNLFYISTYPEADVGKDSLFQFDLLASNILQSKLLLWTDKDSFWIGQHLLAPDGRIYITNSYYLTPNNVLDSTNMYLAVITKPDIYGLGCDFQPYSFYLNGLKSLGGLPNMINYNLDTLHGSACDTLVGIGINELRDKSILNIYPNPASDELTIEVLNGVKPKEIEITNEVGVTAFKLKQTKPNQQVNIKSLVVGVYFVKVIMNDGSVTVRKFVKE